jgi:hypothetical protein
VKKGSTRLNYKNEKQENKSGNSPSERRDREVRQRNQIKTSDRDREKEGGWQGGLEFDSLCLRGGLCPIPLSSSMHPPCVHTRLNAIALEGTSHILFARRGTYAKRGTKHRANRATYDRSTRDHCTTNEN